MNFKIKIKITVTWFCTWFRKVVKLKVKQSTLQDVSILGSNGSYVRCNATKKCLSECVYDFSINDREFITGEIKNMLSSLI